MTFRFVVGVFRGVRHNLLVSQCCWHLCAWSMLNSAFAVMLLSRLPHVAAVLLPLLLLTLLPSLLLLLLLLLPPAAVLCGLEEVSSSLEVSMSDALNLVTHQPTLLLAKVMSVTPLFDMCVCVCLWCEVSMSDSLNLVTSQPTLLQR